MKTESVYDASLKPCGQILSGFDTAALVSAMERIPLRETGADYQPSLGACQGLTGGNRTVG